MRTAACSHWTMTICPAAFPHSFTSFLFHFFLCQLIQSLCNTQFSKWALLPWLWMDMCAFPHFSCNGSDSFLFLLHFFSSLFLILNYSWSPVMLCPLLLLLSVLTHPGLLSQAQPSPGSL